MLLMLTIGGRDPAVVVLHTHPRFTLVQTSRSPGNVLEEVLLSEEPVIAPAPPLVTSEVTHDPVEGLFLH